ncbi:MAG: acyl-CoA thioesterase [Rhizobiaceae bacterium]|nr:MAG: acyl-CoA thioesterase [Rhizobiaceae bacterium]
MQVRAQHAKIEDSRSKFRCVGSVSSHPRAHPMHNLSIRVTDNEIDRMGHVNHSVYLRWIEEAVHAHWTSLATPEEFATYLWLAVRHEIDYRRAAFADDLLRLETRLVTTRRARAWYETVIKREDTTIVEARSCWCCIDAESQRPVAIPADTIARFLSAADWTA